ncbi:hypothetical protein ABDJ41_14240 [Pedobacter sp. ASV1-7]|uniref:hypothetical protein n=1 Tax=Pedobacter sp. ASV1-7 TaxID=3145237 RepID=UPI0032E889A7
MKKIVLMTMVLFALNFATSAQEKKPAVLKYYDTELLDEIGATADQKAKVVALVKEFQPQLTEVNKNASLSADEKKAKLKILYGERAVKYFKILTEEQKAKLKVMQAEMNKNNTK